MPYTSDLCIENQTATRANHGCSTISISRRASIARRRPERPTPSPAGPVRSTALRQRPHPDRVYLGIPGDLQEGAKIVRNLAGVEYAQRLRKLRRVLLRQIDNRRRTAIRQRMAERGEGRLQLTETGGNSVSDSVLWLFSLMSRSWRRLLKALALNLNRRPNGVSSGKMVRQARRRDRTVGRTRAWRWRRTRRAERPLSQAKRRKRRPTMCC